MPAFSGPFKQEFEQAWNESKSEFVRAVISDQTISDEEWAEVGTRISTCLQRSGMTFKGFNADGGYEVDTGTLSGSDANAALPACENESGETWLGYLRTQLSANPDNTPAEARVADCLVRNGVVAEGYTAQDYRNDAPNRSFPYLNPSTGDADLRACSANPDVEIGPR